VKGAKESALSCLRAAASVGGNIPGFEKPCGWELPDQFNAASSGEGTTSQTDQPHQLVSAVPLVVPVALNGALVVSNPLE